MTLTFHRFDILRIFILMAVVLGCQRSRYVDQVSEYPEVKISGSWSMRLPYQLTETGVKGEFYQREFVSPTDSITLEASTDTISIEESHEYFKQAVEFEKLGKVPSPCLGSFKGYSKNYNFIDSTNKLSGYVSDYEENGQWQITFDVISAITGDRLRLGFEKVAPKDIELIHEVIRSIRHYR
jgi:hypothetical protein